MHNARPETSPRLMRVLRVLADGRPHTTLEIQTEARTVATGTCVSELRQCGYEIACEQRRGGEDGRRVWVYSMPRPPTALEMRALEGEGR